MSASRWEHRHGAISSAGGQYDSCCLDGDDAADASWTPVMATTMHIKTNIVLEVISFCCCHF